MVRGLMAGRELGVTGGKMAASGDVTVAQNGADGGYRAHPYLVALVRWCVSCLWSTATILLHRLMTTPLPPITAKVSKPQKPRPASTEHLHPEPLVECVVLHQPETHNIDVIFVHGLYGSLGNTWRQGDWRTKYSNPPNTVPLKRTPIPTEKAENESINENYTNQNIVINTKLMNIADNELYITEKFYNDLEEKFMFNDCQCGGNCEIGCGCTCDSCYSPCWPKDWIKYDHPDARVISINYTSDPYLWRPLWVKGNKRLRLHERAEQMTEQLLKLGVGKRPIIWVGHSKGGLFIKQIYCEAYEAYLKTKNNQNIVSEEGIDVTYDVVKENNINKEIEEDLKYEGTLDNNKCDERVKCDYDGNDFETDGNDFEIDGNDFETDGNDFERVNDVLDIVVKDRSSDNFEDEPSRASLWLNSAGFMFYSVPHRGSPLADIKTPITARSIELLEISKDCSLVLSLQERWLRATASSRPAVRSLVETCRTLMSVLWLRIVSVDSADPGIGALCGVSVIDHREICKPSSRHCLLYKELMNLISAALNKYHCNE